MFFSFENPNNYSTDRARAIIKRQVRNRILCFPLRSVELKLNNYFLTEYDCSLKQMCLKLLRGCKVMLDNTNNITLLFHDEEADKIASFITYGNIEYQGSQILRVVFKDT